MFLTIKKSIKNILKKDLHFNKYEIEGPYHYRDYIENPAYKSHVDYIINYFNKLEKGSLIDIGCGDGLISSLLSDRGFDVTGVDQNETGIKYAREKNPAMKFLIKNADDIDEQFDYVLSSEVIEHLKDPIPFILSIKNKCLKEILITTPEKGQRRKDPLHYVTYTEKKLHQLLTAHFDNFKIVKANKKLYAHIHTNIPKN